MNVVLPIQLNQDESDDFDSTLMSPQDLMSPIKLNEEHQQDELRKRK